MSNPTGTLTGDVARLVDEVKLHICVGAILIRGNSILLAHRAATRDFYPGVWDVIGGHLEPGETPDQCLVRELEEEIGVSAAAWAPLPTLHLRDESGGSVTIYIYAVTDWRGTPRNLLPDEHIEISWFSVEEACGLPLADEGYPVLFRSLQSGRWDGVRKAADG